LLRVEPFADEEDDAEGLLDDPIFEVENAEAEERDEAEQRENLIAPFHEGDVRARAR
jgi:hypothetical protein